jgi:hypothetical protein
VKALAGLARSRDVLDYGCGRGTLAQALDFPIRMYDPCIAGLDAPPQPADVVACTDVLEHIEPDCLDDVLDDLKRVVRAYGLFVIANRPASKILPDGRNAHLIQEPWPWWEPRITSRFHVCEFMPMQGEFAVVVASQQLARQEPDTPQTQAP